MGKNHRQARGKASRAVQKQGQKQNAASGSSPKGQAHPPSQPARKPKLRGASISQKILGISMSFFLILLMGLAYLMISDLNVEAQSLDYQAHIMSGNLPDSFSLASQRGEFDFHDQLFANAMRVLLSFLAFSFLMTVIFIFLIKKFVLRPINMMYDQISEISKGNLEVSLPVVSNDELGALAISFNGMLSQVRSLHAQIKKHEHELEGLIRQRTAQLDDKVTELENARKAMMNMLEDVNFSKEELEKSESQLRALNKRLERALDELKKVDKNKDEFISVTAHELKTPMASIMGFASLLKEEKAFFDAKKRAKYLNIIIDDSVRLKNLVNDLLDLSRLDLGAMKFFFDSVSIPNTMKKVIAELSVLSKAKHITLSASIDKQVPEQILTDGSRLTQVLINLINNAIKFTKPNLGKKVTVSIAMQGKFVRFSVKDSGIGIAKESIRHLFHRFYRVDSSYTREVGGTGLGLAISKGIIEALGGKVGVNSQLGKGSEFWFALPASQPAGTIKKNEDVRKVLPTESPSKQKQKRQAASP